MLACHQDGICIDGNDHHWWTTIVFITDEKNNIGMIEGDEHQPIEATPPSKSSMEPYGRELGNMIFPAKRGDFLLPAMS